MAEPSISDCDSYIRSVQYGKRSARRRPDQEQEEGSSRKCNYWRALDLSQQKEQFSKAYVRAVVAAAGYTVSVPEVDEDSVDFTIHSRGITGPRRSPQLDLQLKCTAAPRAKDPVPFELDRKNYIDLQGDDFTVPRLLIVVFVPTDLEVWLDHSEERLVLSHCGYWLSLRTAASLQAEQKSITVHLPRTQQFCVEQLRSILNNVSAGVMP